MHHFLYLLFVDSGRADKHSMLAHFTFSHSWNNFDGFNQVIRFVAEQELLLALFSCFHNHLFNWFDFIVQLGQNTASISSSFKLGFLAFDSGFFAQVPLFAVDCVSFTLVSYRYRLPLKKKVLEGA